jgi:hypothetical protein
MKAAALFQSLSARSIAAASLGGVGSWLSPGGDVMIPLAG